MKNFIRFFILSNIYLGICVLGLYLAFAEGSYKEPAKLTIEAFIFCATVAVYSILRIRIANYEIKEPTAYLQWLRQNLISAKIVRSVFIVCTVLLFFLLKRIIQVGIISLGLLWILYNLPIFTGGRIKFGLRYVWFLKPFVVGFIAAGLATLVPLFDSNLDITHIIAAMCISFCLTSAIVVIFEIKDMKTDRLFHTETIPIRAGVNGTKAIAIVCLLLSTLLTLLFFPESSISLNVLKISPFIAQSVFVFFMIKEITNDYVYWIVIDGWMWLVGVLWYLIAHHVISI